MKIWKAIIVWMVFFKSHWVIHWVIYWFCSFIWCAMNNMMRYWWVNNIICLSFTLSFFIFKYNVKSCFKSSFLLILLLIVKRITSFFLLYIFLSRSLSISLCLSLFYSISPQLNYHFIQFIAIKLEQRSSRI